MKRIRPAKHPWNERDRYDPLRKRWPPGSLRDAGELGLCCLIVLLPGCAMLSLALGMVSLLLGFILALIF